MIEPKIKFNKTMRSRHNEDQQKFCTKSPRKVSKSNAKFSTGFSWLIKESKSIKESIIFWQFIDGDFMKELDCTQRWLRAIQYLFEYSSALHHHRMICSQFDSAFTYEKITLANQRSQSLIETAISSFFFQFFGKLTCIVSFIYLIFICLFLAVK